jgi:hypothetical protein
LRTKLIQSGEFGLRSRILSWVMIGHADKISGKFHLNMQELITHITSGVLCKDN